MRMTCNDVIPSFRSLSVDIIGHVLVASLAVQIVQVDVITSATLLALHVPLISLDILTQDFGGHEYHYESGWHKTTIDCRF